MDRPPLKIAATVAAAGTEAIVPANMGSIISRALLPHRTGSVAILTHQHHMVEIRDTKVATA